MRFALPFQDDSSLFFAASMSEALRVRGHIPVVLKVLERGGKVSKLSDRQVQNVLGVQGPDFDITEAEFMEDAFLKNFDALVVSRLTRAQRERMATPTYRNRPDRPCFVAFQAGLEFTPEKGAANRQWFDVVFASKPEDQQFFQNALARGDDQHVSWGHPYFMIPTRWREAAEDAPVYFFTQSISPTTLSGRLHLLTLLIALARFHPRRDIVLKLRHLPSENALHAHREKFAYPWLLDRFFTRRPANLRFEAGAINDALAQAGLAITCTSTAAMDSISAGVPTMLYLDYVENYHDYTVEPMRTLFRDSGVVASLPDLLALRARPPAADWLARRFRGPEFYDDLIGAVARRQGRRRT